jgi:hypothetical protein
MLCWFPYLSLKLFNLLLILKFDFKLLLTQQFDPNCWIPCHVSKYLCDHMLDLVVCHFRIKYYAKGLWILWYLRSINQIFFIIRARGKSLMYLVLIIVLDWHFTFFKRSVDLEISVKPWALRELFNLLKVIAFLIGILLWSCIDN